jgi:hypothetical protein
MRDLSGEPTESQILSVYDEPIMVHVAGFCAVCFHDQSPKGSVKKGARMVIDRNLPFNRYFATQ